MSLSFFFSSLSSSLAASSNAFSPYLLHQGFRSHYPQPPNVHSHTHISAAEHEECIPGYCFHKKRKKEKERKERAKLEGNECLKLSSEKPRQHIKKQRYCFADKGPSSKSYGFSRNHVWIVNKAERQRIDAFELWYWRRLLRVLA